MPYTRFDNNSPNRYARLIHSVTYYLDGCCVQAVQRFFQAIGLGAALGAATELVDLGNTGPKNPVGEGSLT